MKDRYQVKGNKFIIEDYNNAKAFSSFFPAIAGLFGKPMWAFYVNRGQGIACFGTKDKDGAILEFNAANKAYRQTPLQGFRTFIKENNNVYEPFKNDALNIKNGIKQTMLISSYDFTVKEVNKKQGYEIVVEYFTVPKEKIPAIARKLTIKNISKKLKNIECIDGLPLVLPYGTNNFMLKNISRLAEGWYNGVFFSKNMKVPVYKLPIEPLDRPEVILVEKANFYTGFFYKNNKIKKPEFIIDSDSLFGEVRDFSYPSTFVNSKKFEIDPTMTGKNKTPSGMGYFKESIKPGDEITYYSIVGTVNHGKEVDNYVKKMSNKDYFVSKKKENEKLINTISNDVITKSSSDKFDNYCQQNFVDNLLRGGYPVTLGNKTKKNYYVYSRIHGDMEREYNNFVVLPEYFSQGNGNYRDVNQNRRSDIFINTDIKDESIITFMNLLQLDGFNPLKIMGAKFYITEKNEFYKIFKDKDIKIIEDFVKEPFTLGDFFNFLDMKNITSKVNNKRVINAVIDFSEKLDCANAGECYWSDHWHYNIDLIENYLAVYPEKLKELLLDNKIFAFYDNAHIVLPRKDKYVIFDDQARQLDAVYIHPEKDKRIKARRQNRDVVRTQFGKGKIYKTILIGKLLNLVANKYASLDPDGIGVEMESDRPNWCDALNGVPGTFGSSTAESLELKRLLLFLISSLKLLKLDHKTNIVTNEETIDFLLKLEDITNKFGANQFKFWDTSHTLKEDYRQKTLFGISGKEKDINIKKLLNLLNIFLKKTAKGLLKAHDKKTGIITTYFQYEVIKYKVLKEKGKEKKSRNGYTCIEALSFKRQPLPYFLEGPVHDLRINNDEKFTKKVNASIKKSGLYDKKLDMVKINAPLKDVDMSTGRITVFTAGWLENESIWLHMEYKYLLELLRNKCADEFYSLSETALIPFMDPNVYGRSIFENSSFLVSSAHPEAHIHGQGFVARLSGSTAEFISIWIAITSGLKPFSIENGKLNLRFDPQIASSMFTKRKEKVTIYNKNGNIEEIIVPENSFMFKFLAKTILIYHNPLRKNTYGKKQAKISRITMTYANNKKLKINNDIISGQTAYDIRDGKVKRIDIELK